MKTKDEIMNEAYHRGYRTGIQGKPHNLRPPTWLIITAPELLAEFHHTVRKGHADGQEQALLIRKELHHNIQEQEAERER